MFFVIGIALLVGGYFWYRQNQRWKETAQRASGRVLNLQQEQEQEQDGRAQTFWFATVGFKVAGQSYQFRDPMSVNPNLYAVGTEHPVLYNPQKPADARLARDMVRADQ